MIVPLLHGLPQLGSGMNIGLDPIVSLGLR